MINNPWKRALAPIGLGNHSARRSRKATPVHTHSGNATTPNKTAEALQLRGGGRLTAAPPRNHLKPRMVLLGAEAFAQRWQEQASASVEPIPAADPVEALVAA